jgi:hypothetical protein
MIAGVLDGLSSEQFARLEPRIRAPGDKLAKAKLEAASQEQEPEQRPAGSFREEVATLIAEIAATAGLSPLEPFFLTVERREFAISPHEGSGICPAYGRNRFGGVVAINKSSLPREVREKVDELRAAALATRPAEAGEMAAAA